MTLFKLKCQTIVKGMVWVLASGLAGSCSNQKKFDQTTEATKDMRDTTQDMLEVMKGMQGTTEGMRQETKDNMTSMNDQMDRMVDTTEKMAETTTKMAETTEKMQLQIDDLSERTQQLEEKADELSADARQAVAALVRGDSLDRVISAPYVEQKFSEAGKYFMSFEYQLWKKDSRFDKDKRIDALYLDAIREFFRTIHGYVAHRRWDLDVWCGAPYSLAVNCGHNTNLTLQALAAIMYVHNTNQMVFSKKDDQYQPMTLMRTVQEALTYQYEMNQGKKDYKDIPAHLDEILIWKNDAEYLLQLRHNYVAAVILHKLARYEDSGWPFASKALGMLPGGWKPNFSYFSQRQSELNEMRLLIQDVARTRHFLTGIGIKLKYDESLRSILTNLKLKELFGEKFVANNPEAASFLKALACLQNPSRPTQECDIIVP